MRADSARPRAFARSLALAAGMAAALILLFAGPASAHASVVSSSPADGSGSAAGPARVTVTFDEPVQIDEQSLRVFGPSGALTHTGPVSHGAGGDAQVTVAMPAGLAHGTYTAAWQVISADSHPVHGAFTFWVGAPGGKAPAISGGGSASAGLGFGYGLLRWLAFAGLALLVGVAAFALCCWPDAVARARVRRLLVGGWLALVAASVGILLIQGPYARGGGLSTAFAPAVVRETLGSRLGVALIARLLVLGLATGYLAWLLARVRIVGRRERIWLGCAGGALAVALAATWAGADHAATGIQVALAVPVDVVHLLAMAVWLGGLATLVVALPARSADTTSAAAGPALPVAAAVPRFSRIAFGCVSALTLTGAYQTWRQVGTPPALAATAYGELLLFKLGVLAVLIVMAYFARDWVRRLAGGVGRDVAALRRSVLSEALLATVVLAVTALLVDAAPARTAYAAPVAASAGYDTGGANGTGMVRVLLTPARAGANELRVQVDDANGRPRVVPELRAELSLPGRGIGPLPITLSQAGPGLYQAAAVPVPLSGRWRLDLTVRTSPIDETTVSVPAAVR